MDKGFVRVYSALNFNSIIANVSEKSIILINPIAIVHSENTSLKDVREFSQKHGCLLIAIAHSYIDDDFLSQFDGYIKVSDDIATIIGKIDALSGNLSDSYQPPQSDSVLSDREKDVVKLIALGYSNKEIANDLNISVHTAISHRKNITSKLDVKSSSAITIYALINKIISEDDFNKSI